MLFRIATARGRLLGKVEVCSVKDDSLYDIDNSSGRGSEVVVCNAPVELEKGSAANKNLGAVLRTTVGETFSYDWI